MLMGPLSFTVTTTGMSNVTHLSDVRIASFFSSATTLMGPQDVALVDGVGQVTFTEQLLLEPGETTYRFVGAIPSDQRVNVENGATITISAAPADSWVAVGQTSGVADPISPASLVIGKSTIDTSSGGSGGGVIIDTSAGGGAPAPGGGT